MVNPQKRTERTADAATIGDVADAMRWTPSPAEAESFLNGYAQDLARAEPYTDAREIAVENLRQGAGRYFSDRADLELLELWEGILY